ncbi:MAG: hypothetical protein Q9M26_08235 [Mariprofundales bacterium]|nr:hypothetical protein [Mariprofundales bacterium]
MGTVTVSLLIKRLIVMAGLVAWWGIPTFVLAQDAQNPITDKRLLIMPQDSGLRKFPLTQSAVLWSVSKGDKVKKLQMRYPSWIKVSTIDGHAGWINMHVFPSMQRGGAAQQSAAMTIDDRTKLVAAVENFKFQDYDAAIPQLRILHQRYPTNHEVLRTLARALDESGQAHAAVPVLQAWIKYYPEDRKAYMTLARALAKTGKPTMANLVIQAWLRTHPKDNNARINLINALVRSTKSQQHNQAKALALKVTKNHTAHRNILSAAHYYLAYIALRQNDEKSAKKEARASINANPSSTYALRSKAMIQQIRRSGINPASERPSISVGSYHTSNASLLPEQLRQNPLLRSNPSIAASDTALQTTINLGYRKDLWLLSYNMSSTVYQYHYDLNLLSQRITLSRQLGHIAITPRYEYIRLGKDFLYQGAGLDLTWQPSRSLTLYYGGTFKAFNNYFISAGNVADLGRLSGFSHDLMAQYSLPGFTPTDFFSLGTTLHDEKTRGDATHPQSDSYRQAGGFAGWSGVLTLPRAHLNIYSNVNVQGYYRSYLHFDPTIFPAGHAIKRKDRFIQYSYRLSSKPFKSLPMTWSGYWQWQRNHSNYNENIFSNPGLISEFSEWRIGGELQWRF